MKTLFILVGVFTLSSCSGAMYSSTHQKESPIVSEELVPASRIQWTLLRLSSRENVEERILYEEVYGEGNELRLNQSMSIYGDYVFCFNDCRRQCKVINMKTLGEIPSDLLPESSHHNNAQFLDIFASEERYPLLLLSQGNYPPNNEFLYVIQVKEIGATLSFSIVKTIKCQIPSCQNNGSWVADTENKRLFLYTMTKSDWRTTADNFFCIYSFDLPNLIDGEEIILKQDDVKDYWQYPYLIHQGGTYYNGYLFFNVQSLPAIDDYATQTDKNILAINAKTGVVEAVMPLTEEMETEGISVSNEQLYVSFKNGNAQQAPDNTVFKIMRYSLPKTIINN